MRKSEQLIRHLLKGAAFCAIAMDGRCHSASEAEVLRLAPSHAAFIPEWGMHEGIIIFARDQAELTAYLTGQPREYTATLYDFQAGTAQTGRIADWQG